MENYGLILFMLAAIGLALTLSILAVILKPLRRFALAALVTPPFLAGTFLLTRWMVLDSGRVCGPDPEWNRCPSAAANLTGWAIWSAGILIVPIAAYWAQRIIQAAIRLWFDSSAMSVFNNRPRWSRTS